MDAKLKEVEFEIRAHLKAKLEQGIEETNKNADDIYINEQTTFVSDSAEKPIIRPSF
ncbi:MAG: hypothetical protein RLY40_287 [Pseudomonadota bacterium]|jgi:DNA-binding transcriptional regulator YbjK